MKIRTGFFISMAMFGSVADARDLTVKMNPDLCVATTDACVPNLFSLMATPEIYDGYVLELDGFVSWGGTRPVFYVDAGQACNQVRGAGLELHLQSELSDEVKDLLSRNGVGRVRVSGRLAANSRGDRGGYVSVLNHAVVNASRTYDILRSDPKLVSREDPIEANFLRLPEATCK